MTDGWAAPSEPAESTATSTACPLGHLHVDVLDQHLFISRPFNLSRVEANSKPSTPSTIAVPVAASSLMPKYIVPPALRRPFERNGMQKAAILNAGQRKGQNENVC